MPLLKVPIVENSHILVAIYFTFLKQRPEKKLDRLPIPNLGLNEKIGKLVIN